MNITIGDYQQATRTVPVTFEHAGVTHERNVNACLDDSGWIDPEATAARVADVARGVEIKIEAGAITNPPAPEPVEPEA